MGKESAIRLSILDKDKSHETTIAEYHHDKENRQDSMAFLATVPVSIDATMSALVKITEDFLPTCSQCGLITISQAVVLPPVHNVAGVADLTIGSTCATV